MSAKHNFVVAAVILTTGIAGGLAVSASAQVAHRVDAIEVQAKIAEWPAAARAKALELIKRNGMPDEVTDSALVWDTGAIKRKQPKSDPTIVEGSSVAPQTVADSRN